MESYSEQFNKHRALVDGNNPKQYPFLVPSRLVYDHDRDVYHYLYAPKDPSSINNALQSQPGIKKMLNDNVEKISKEITNAQSGGTSKANILSSLNTFVVNQVDSNLLRITAEDKAEIHSYILKVAELFNVSSERKKR